VIRIDRHVAYMGGREIGYFCNVLIEIAVLF
jgi:hypothetical protein